MVQVKKARKRVEVKGTNSKTQLKGVAAPARKISLFVGRLDPATTSEAVVLHVQYILGSTGDVQVVEIPHCQAKYGYKGFRVTVPAEAANSILQSDKWPTHVAVRKFYPPKVGAALKLTRSTSAGDVTVR